MNIGEDRNSAIQQKHGCIHNKPIAHMHHTRGKRGRKKKTLHGNVVMYIEAFFIHLPILDMV